MKKTCVIHQPDFLPYLGFFDRLVNAEVLVLLDTVQFVRHSSRSWTHRDKIKTANGEKWISVSCAKSALNTAIRDIVIAPGFDAAQAHLPLWQAHYKDAKFFAQIFPFLERLYAGQPKLLVDLTIPSIRMLIDLFAIEVDIVYASALGISGSGNELLVNILRKVGCKNYLSGVGAKAYFDAAPFMQAEIEVVWQNFLHPVYPQLYGEFVPGLSSVDLLMNCGIDESRKILRAKQP